MYDFIQGDFDKMIVVLPEFDYDCSDYAGAHAINRKAFYQIFCTHPEAQERLESLSDEQWQEWCGYINNYLNGYGDDFMGEETDLELAGSILNQMDDYVRVWTNDIGVNPYMLRKTTYQIGDH
ncbi:hypothetical protein [Shewanella sp. SE1]|uniref:hypothetical protein n=1 Tax=Shewanella sp. SE1 TaxID=2705014 RepID=UPI00138EF745|nr:hypothetical protein [Shewanella sp. SE1]NDO73086.1 hypothetical protein [Shewanella sp. SE1]